METNQQTTTSKPGETEKIIRPGKDNPANGIAAHDAAEADILQDPDLNGTAGKGDDLDEGELARLEGEE